MKDLYINHEQEKIAEWLKKVRFRKKLFGGIDEQDVWQKIEQLNEMYESALSAERARYDALLRQQRSSSLKYPKTSKAVRSRKELRDDREE